MVAATVVLSLSLGSAAMIALLAQHSRISELTMNLEPAIAANRQVLQAMTDSETGIRGYQLTGEGAFLAPYQQSQLPLADGLATVEALGPAGGLDDLPRQQRVAVDAWLTGFAEPVTKMVSPRVTRAEQETAKAAFDTFREVNQHISDVLAAQNTALIRRSNLTTGWVVVGVAALSLVCAGLIWVRGRQAIRAICPPLEQLHSVVLANRHGNRTARANPSVGVTEVREVAASVNDLVDISEQQRARLEENLRMADAVRQIGRTTSGSLDLDAIIDRCVQPLAHHFNPQQHGSESSKTMQTCPAAASELPIPRRRRSCPPNIFWLARSALLKSLGCVSRCVS